MFVLFQLYCAAKFLQLEFVSRCLSCICVVLRLCSRDPVSGLQLEYAL
jgi:hypothetical protein